MRSTVLWAIWSILPVFAIAFHYGPGQRYVRADAASRAASIAASAEAEAERLHALAHQAHLNTFAVAKRTFLELEVGADPDPARTQEIERLLEAETRAYAEASDAWMEAAERYAQAAAVVRSPELSGAASTDEPTRAELEMIDRLQLHEARARVRGGEVFNGVKMLREALDRRVYEAAERNETADDGLTLAVREELAAAQYIGARLLREEGRPGAVWRKVSAASRQQFRYLAERASDEDSGRAESSGELTDAQRMQRNVEHVLDLEQSDRSKLDGLPLPQPSPRGRRPGDGEPGDGEGNGSGRTRRPGRGPPATGASGAAPYGPGW